MNKGPWHLFWFHNGEWHWLMSGENPRFEQVMGPDWDHDCELLGW